MNLALSDRLERALIERDLDEIKALLPELPAAAPSANPRFLDCIARCIDLDWRLRQPVEDAVRVFPSGIDVLITDRARLDIVEGLVAFHYSDFRTAYRHFVAASTLAARTSDADLQSITLYYMARASWRIGDYALALDHVRRAKTTAASASLLRRIVLMEMLEAWLVLLAGEFEAADRLVANVEAKVGDSRDHITKGDVLSFRGRRARLFGRTENLVTAEATFKRAIDEYTRFDPEYRNIARCHKNLAYVRYLQIRALAGSDGKVKPAVREEIQEHNRIALDHSRLAEQIFAKHAARSGLSIANVLYDRALLHYRQGDLEEGLRLAEQAFDMGSLASHPVTMANARVVSCMIELERGVPSTALGYARAAVELAEKTENRRLKARAYVWLGMVLLESPFADVAEARAQFTKASEKMQAELGSGHSDYLIEDLNVLGRRIAEHEGKDGEAWGYRLTSGMIRHKRLKDTLADVRREVIRHVYAENKENAAKTASELRINAEKVTENIDRSRPRKRSRQGR